LKKKEAKSQDKKYLFHRDKVLGAIVLQRYINILECNSVAHKNQWSGVRTFGKPSWFAKV
jgi:hypothetical protein